MQIRLPVAQTMSMCSAFTRRITQLPPKRPSMKKASANVSTTDAALSDIQPLAVTKLMK